MRSLLLPLSLLLHSISSAHPTPLRAAETVGDPDLADRAREIHQQGRFEEAIALLKKRLAEDGKDRECRLLLGRFFDYEGEPEEAVRVWESGLTGEKEDLPLLMAVGQIRARQGDDGPEVTYRRGTSTSGPVKDEKGAETFKKDRYRLAARAYEKAMKLRPDLLEPGQELVEVLLALEESEAAVKLLADLRKTFPGESRLLLR